MHGRSVIAVAIFTVLVVSGPLVKCGKHDTSIDPSTIEEVEVITVGESVEFAKTACGQLSFFTGRIVYRDSRGATRPVADATFWFQSADGSSRRKLLIEVGDDGTFDQSIGKIGADYLVLSEDGSISQDGTSAFPIVVRAGGCDDHAVSFTPDWEDTTIILECPMR